MASLITSYNYLVNKFKKNKTKEMFEQISRYKILWDTSHKWYIEELNLGRIHKFFRIRTDGKIEEMEVDNAQRKLSEQKQSDSVICNKRYRSRAVKLGFKTI